MTDQLTDEAVKALAHKYRFAKDDNERTIAKTAEALLDARADAQAAVALYEGCFGVTRGPDTPPPEAAPTPAPVDWEARRWEAALAAMQGLLAGYYAQTTRHNLGEVPEEAVQIADALIAAMQEKKP